MAILLVFSFLAGFITILAPCIWPLLPIVLSASSGTGKRRPLGITLGVMSSFSIFTLSISYLEKILHLNPNIFRLVAVGIIGTLGICMMIPALGAAFESFINEILSPFQNKIKKQGTGFGAGYATGFSIGLVWAPCAGPILATIATLAATQAVNGKVVLVTLAYVVGLGIPLFLFSLAGSRIFSKMRQLTKYTGRIQQVFGLIMVLAALLIYTNYDKLIQVKILDLFPSYGSFLNKVENNAQVTQQLSNLRGEKDSVSLNDHGLRDYGLAPEFFGIDQWLNSTPLTMTQLKGKVVLVDFWTYSCVNCVRTLPHVIDWYEKYKNHNFIVVGVHTPEFAFEKEVENVQNALKEFGINYPVALDNDYGTWKAYNNRYWPAEYLIDAQGHIRLEHFGEGHYDEMETAIRALLEEGGNILDISKGANKDNTPHYVRTPETYLGKKRMERFSSNEKVLGGFQTFTFPLKISQDSFAYEGPWTIKDQAAEAQSGSSLEIRFNASKVFLVISPKNKGDQVRLWLDGKPVEESAAGMDVRGSIITLDEDRLYNLIDLKGKVESHLLRLEFLNDGNSVYAFTFG